MGISKRLALVIFLVAVVSASAALFGPSERMSGVDLGATGAALFMLTLGAGIWLFAVRGADVFSEHLSIAERRAWVGLVFLAFVLASFVQEMLTLARHAAIPERPSDFFALQFIQRLIVIVIAWAVISQLIGRRADIEADERDLRLQHKADRAADWALTLIVMAGIVVLASLPRELLSWWLAPIVLANLLIGLLIAKSLVEHLALAIFYRSSRA